jgi:predicted permease
MRVNLSGNSYASPEARRRFITELVDRLDALPGVRQAGAASVLPTGGANWVPQVIPEGTAASSPSGVFVASQIVATPGHFGALGIRVTRGRDFSAQDGPDSPGVVIVNEALARRHWPSGDPIGRRLRYRMGPGNDSPWLTVVGVVSDVLYAENDVQRAVTYLPHRQQPARTMNLAIGTAADPLSLAAPVRQVIADLDAGLAPTRIQSMERTVSDSRWQPLLIGWMFGLFGVLALILAAVGIYGVVAYSVSRRTHEIGIRIALGAETGRVRRSLLSRTLATVSAGIAAGLLAAYWVGGLLRPLLYGLSPGDPITLGGTTLVLLGVAAGACYAPARAASRSEPVSALRCA